MKSFISLMILGVLFLCRCSQGGRDMSTTDTTDSSQNELPDTSVLYRNILCKDSVLFNEGFNSLDTAIVSSLISDDFEFYHDEHGITETKSDFLQGIASLKELPFKIWRVVKTESFEVFPMYTSGKSELYGAVQNGVHEFYQQKEGEKACKTSVARFSHLWVIENGEWKLKRVFSYDHQ